MDNQESKMKNKPKFKRQQAILKKLKNRWRKPKGLHSKLRLNKGGKGKKPKIGYGAERKSREHTPVMITNVNNLDSIKQPIIISSRLGLKKRLSIINKAKELNIKIINIKDVDKFLEESKKRLEKIRKEKQEKKENKFKKSEKVKKEAQKEENKEEKDKKLKEEKRKVLEKGL
jgi:large subunit ribosomal protein L32e